MAEAPAEPEAIAYLFSPKPTSLLVCTPAPMLGPRAAPPLRRKCIPLRAAGAHMLGLGEQVQSRKRSMLGERLAVRRG